MKTVSQDLANRALKVLPGGVNSPVRNMKSVEQKHPFFAKKAFGHHLYSVENIAYVDWCQTWGSMILGHAHPQVIKAIEKTLMNGIHFGCSTEQEVLFAESLMSAVPSLEQIRCVSSGTEATMSAIRLARGYTKRNLVIKFSGCYHGHADPFLVSAGSGLSEIQTASSSGVPAGAIKDVVCIAYNDTESVCDFFKNNGDRISSVIVEPIAANMGVIVPNDDFLRTLRTLTHKHGALLIFDEVITGFRLALGGAQERFGITPDITCLGKIIGGGFNLGIFGACKDIMQHIAPCGSIYQAGTLSGHPLAMTAGIEILKILKTPDFYQNLENFSKQSISVLKMAAKKSPYPIRIQSEGSLFSIFFSEKETLSCFQDVQKSDHKLFATFHKHSFNHRHFLSPSGYETLFIGQAHTQKNIEELAYLIETFRIPSS